MRRTFPALRPGPLSPFDARRLSEAIADLWQQVDIRCVTPLNLSQGPAGPILTLDSQAVRNVPAGSTIEYPSGSTVIFDGGSTLQLGSGGSGGSTFNLNLGGPSAWDLKTYNLTWQATGSGAVVLAGLGVVNNLQGIAVFNEPFEICGVQLWCDYTPTTWAATPQNDWSVTTAATVYRISTSLTNADLTGIRVFNVNSVRQPQIICLMNVGTVAGGNGTITLKNQSGSSVGANQFLLPGLADIVLQCGDALLVWYDRTATAWRPVNMLSAWSTGTTNTAIPQWTTYTKTFTDFSAAAALKTLNLVTVAARTVLQGYAIDVVTPFTGGGTTNATIELGSTGTTTSNLFAAQSVNSAMTHPTYDATSLNNKIVNWSAGDTITATLRTTGGNTSVLTAGSMTISLFLATVP